jgi:hypothetical protein
VLKYFHPSPRYRNVKIAPRNGRLQPNCFTRVWHYHIVCCAESERQSDESTLSLFQQFYRWRRKLCKTTTMAISVKTSLNGILKKQKLWSRMRTFLVFHFLVWWGKFFWRKADIPRCVSYSTVFELEKLVDLYDPRKCCSPLGVQCTHFWQWFEFGIPFQFRTYFSIKRFSSFLHTTAVVGSNLILVHILYRSIYSHCQITTRQWTP